jgi:phosphate transport system substrate-binding protein
MKKLMAAVLAVMFMAPVVTAWDWPWVQKSANKLSTQGSTTVLPIAQKAAEEFMKINAKADVSVSGGGSGVGIAALIDGSCDIANSSRPIKSKEIVLAKQKGVNPVETIIANDGIAIIVNPVNKALENITINKLKAIYSGEITKWSQAGGTGESIVIISRDSASGTFEVFNELVLRGAKLIDSSLMMASNKEIVETVSKTPGAIGYVGLGYITPEVKTVKVEGVVASDATVLDKTYKLARPLFMYTNGAPAGLAKEFLDFILSEQGQNDVKAAGFVKVK